MDTRDDLLSDFLPKRNESLRFTPSQASVSTSTNNRSRLSLSHRRQTSIVRTTQPLRNTSFIEPLAVDKKNIKRTKLESTKKNVFCLKCGIPERLLIHTLAFHASTCKGKKDARTEDCQLGEACLSTVARHFLTHRHTLSPNPSVKTRCTTVPTIKSECKQEISHNDFNKDIISSSSESNFNDSPRHITSPTENLTTTVNDVMSRQEIIETRVETNVNKINDISLVVCEPGTAMNNSDDADSSQETFFTCSSPEKTTPIKDKQTCDDPRETKDSCTTCRSNASSVKSLPKVPCRTCCCQKGKNSPNVSFHPPAKSLAPIIIRRISSKRYFCEEVVESPSLLENPADPSNFVVGLSGLNSKPMHKEQSKDVNEPGDNFDICSARTVRREAIRAPAKTIDSCNLRLSGGNAAECHARGSRESEKTPKVPFHPPVKSLAPIITRRISSKRSFSDDFDESPSLLENPDPSIFVFNSRPMHEEQSKDNGEPGDNFDICSVRTVRREAIRSPAKTIDSCDLRLSGGTAVKCHASVNGKSEQTPVRSSTVPCQCDVPDEGADEGVSANVTVRVSPFEAASTDGPAPVAVKVNATCCESGWEDVGIDADTDVSVRDVRVSLCECAKKLLVTCRANRNSNSKQQIRSLQPKFHSTMKELGISRTASTTNSKSKRQVQLSITSFLKCSKKSKTIPKEDEDEVECLSISSSDLSVREANKEPTLERQQKSKLEWQKLMKVNKSNDFTYVSAGSSSEGSHSGGSDRVPPLLASKKCPFYKRIPDTTFVVDAFNYGNIPGVDAYFLSHFHYDHYIGLRRSFNKQIYCTRITASLVRLKVGVNNQFLNELEIDKMKVINGVRVTALEANHCPGSAMFLFQLPNGKTFLHVGDFRADPVMESYPAFWNLSIDKLFLDTTYCNPRYTFPSQLDTIAEVVRCAEVQLAQQPKTLFVCGSYTIGKEKVFVGVAEAIDAKVWAGAGKRRILNLLEDPAISSRLVTDPLEARVHVCEMKYINHEHLQAQLSRYRLKFTHILAFKPSGWEYSNGWNLSRVCRGNVTVVGVPYSEHSSFSELRRFVQFVKPAQVIPTVNVGRPEMRNEMQKHFDQWLKESKQDLRHFFPRQT